MDDLPSIESMLSALGPNPDPIALRNFQTTIRQQLAHTNPARLDVTKSPVTTKLIEGMSDGLPALYRQVYDSYHRHTTFELDMLHCMHLNASFTKGPVTNLNCSSISTSEALQRSTPVKKKPAFYSSMLSSSQSHKADIRKLSVRFVQKSIELDMKERNWMKRTLENIHSFSNLQFLHLTFASPVSGEPRRSSDSSKFSIPMASPAYKVSFTGPPFFSVAHLFTRQGYVREPNKAGYNRTHSWEQFRQELCTCLNRLPHLIFLRISLVPQDAGSGSLLDWVSSKYGFYPVHHDREGLGQWQCPDGGVDVECYEWKAEWSRRLEFDKDAEWDDDESGEEAYGDLPEDLYDDEDVEITLPKGYFPNADEEESLGFDEGVRKLEQELFGLEDHDDQV